MQKFELTHKESHYLSDTLAKVSRSFALVIPTLEKPFTYYLATAYLICRVVDNIEYCTQPFIWKESRLQECCNPSMMISPAPNQFWLAGGRRSGPD